MYWLGAAIGGLVPTLLLSRLLLWLTREWNGGAQRLLVVHGLSLLAAMLIGGMGMADSGAFAPMQALAVFAVPQAIWFMVDAARAKTPLAAPASRADVSRPSVLSGETSKPATRDAELLFWNSINSSDDPADYRAYLERYPDGEFAALARNKLARMQVDPLSNADAPAPAPPVARNEEAARPSTSQPPPLNVTAPTTAKRHEGQLLILIALSLLVAVLLAGLVWLNSASTAGRLQDAAAHYRRGVELAQAGNPSDAVASFDEAVRLNPRDGAAYWARGVARQALGHLDNAIADYDQAVRMGVPDMALVYESRGLAHGAKSNYSQAIADFGEAIRLEPSRGSSYYNRALARAQQREFDGAIADYKLALDLLPGNWQVLYGRASAYAAKGQHELAIPDYDRAIAAMPSNAAAYADRGAVYALQRNFERALADQDEAIRLDPTNPEWLNSRCWTRALWGHQLSQALADCDRSLSIRRQAHVLDSRALVRFRREEFAAALADFDAAYRMNAAQVDSLYGRGVSRLRVGQSAEGRADIAAALAADPNVEARYRSYGIER